MFAFEKALVYHCSPTLSGLKPANLLSLSKRDYPHLPELAEEYSLLLSSKGIQLEIVCSCGQRWLLLVFRPQMLAGQLADRRAFALLRQAGYPVLADPPAQPGGFALSSEEKALPVRRLPARDRPLSGLSAGGCHRLLPAQGRGLQAVRLLEGLRRRGERKKKLCSVRPLPRTPLFPPAVRRSAAGAGRRAAFGRIKIHDLLIPSGGFSYE